MISLSMCAQWVCDGCLAGIRRIYIFQMGNLITQSLQLCSLQWIPPKNLPNIRSITSPDDITHPQHTKILIPLSSIAKRRDFVLKHHHQVILLRDSNAEQHLATTTLRGIPLVREEDVLKDPSSCGQLHFDTRFCPVPLVLERFHESYIKNYVNSFRFYGIEVLAYSKTEEYLRAACCNPFLVCSNYELEQLSFKMQGRAGRERQRLTVLCFCNKDEYELSKRIQLFLQREGIEVSFFKNLLDIIERLNAGSLSMPAELRVRTERVLFYLSEKEKEVEYLSKMAKRLQKSVRNIVVEKVNSRQELMTSVCAMNYSIIVVSSDPKEMRSYFQLYEALEKEGLEDRVIFVRREHEISEKLTQRVYSVVEKHKYRRTSIFEKEAVFYGSLDFFKHVLRSFPSLRFKRFIDASKEREKVRPFLAVPTELVISSVRLCGCQEYFGQEAIRCRVVHIRGKSSLRSQERREEACEKEHWVAEEEELLAACAEGELLSVNFHYNNKKASYVGKTLSDFFAKMKEKKTVLYNKLNEAMFLFSAEYYTLDQICGFVLRLFSSKALGNYEHDCLFTQLKTQLYSELEFLSRSRRIEQAVLDQLEGDCSKDIFQFSHAVMGLLVEHGQMLEEVNSIWALLLCQDRKEHQTNCQVLLFLLLLAFSKTSFLKYSNETLQGLTLRLRKDSTAYDPDNLASFRSKNRNNFVYNVEFLLCEVLPEGVHCDPSDILIRVQGNELTSFNLYMPLWRSGSRVLVAPFTKFEINLKPERDHLLKLSVNSQHKLLEKFAQTFLEENPAQLRLFEEGREMRRFDVFLDSMAHSRFQTAGYILKKIVKEESMANEDCFNAFCVLYHLKRNELGLAEERLRADKYHAILTRVIKGLREGEPSEEKCLITENFSSSKRIEENCKEYQNMEETSNDNESFDNSAMIHTDPEMIKQLSSDYRLNLMLRNRSPSSKLKDKAKHKTGSRIPIHNKRKQDLSICDKLSESSKASRKDRQVNIVILPPNRQLTSNDKGNCFHSSTFGNKFLTEYSSMSSQKEKAHKEEITELMRVKSTRSDAGELLSAYEENGIQSTPMLKRISSAAKPSQFCIENERQMDFSEADTSRDELALNETGLTGNFHFQAARADNQQSEQIIQEKEEMEEVVEESEKSSSKASQRNKSTMEESSFFEGLPKTREKMFPIKRKEVGKRKSLTLQQQNLNVFESPLRNIEEQRSSQLSNSNSHLLLSPSEKEEQVRNKENKLFTFFKISETFKPRFSISSNKNSLNLSHNSHLERIDEKKESLFYDFEEEEKLEGASSLNSISSIDIESIQQVHPQQLLQRSDIM